MDNKIENLYEVEDLKKAFDMGFQSAVSIYEKILGLPQDGQFPQIGQQNLIECLKNKTLLSRFLRKILFNQTFNLS